jgi:hypothetical protein
MFGQRKKQKAEAAASSAALEDAFNQLDLFGNRLDALKQSYNEQAKSLAALPTPVPPPSSSQAVPTPSMTFHPPLQLAALAPPLPEHPKPEGRYSAVTRPQEMPAVRPPPRVVPRPEPRPQEEPKRSRSGRFYLQLAEASDTEALRKAREEVSKCGRIVDSGQGTASDPEAGWLEVAVRAEDTGSFIVKLEELGVKSQVERVVEISPGEGRLQARQFDLFRKKQDSGSGI